WMGPRVTSSRTTRPPETRSPRQIRWQAGLPYDRHCSAGPRDQEMARERQRAPHFLRNLFCSIPASRAQCSGAAARALEFSDGSCGCNARRALSLARTDDRDPHWSAAHREVPDTVQLAGLPLVTIGLLVAIHVMRCR